MFNSCPFLGMLGYSHLNCSCELRLLFQFWFLLFSESVPFLVVILLPSILYPMEWLPWRRLIFLYLHKIIQLVWSTICDVHFLFLFRANEVVLLWTSWS